MAILDIHAKNLALENTADLDILATGTRGFSGADLKNLLNEATIAAARRSGDLVTRAVLDDARDKVPMMTSAALQKCHTGWLPAEA